MFDVQRHGDGTATVTIDRADKLNAMNVEFFEQLPRTLDALDADPEVRACVLTGAGRAFSAGGDIDSFHDLTNVDAYRRHLRLVFDSFHSVERAETIVIAAVNGDRLRRRHRADARVRHGDRVRPRPSSPSRRRRWA